MTNLQELLASDLSKATPESLTQGIQDAELAFGQAQAWSGRLVAALKTHHGLSWSDLVKVTGLKQTTLHRRAQPYL